MEAAAKSTCWCWKEWSGADALLGQAGPARCTAQIACSLVQFVAGALLGFHADKAQVGSLRAAMLVATIAEPSVKPLRVISTATGGSARMLSLSCLLCLNTESGHMTLTQNTAVPCPARHCTSAQHGTISPLGYCKVGSAPAGADVENNVAVAISSDKGLCGGINSTVSKYTRAVLKTTEGGELIFKPS